MIIFGSTSKTNTESSGEFHCPHCNSKKPYDFRVTYKYGHIYWIPLFKGEELGRYVECTTCNNKYNDTVLKYDPEGAANEVRGKVVTVLMSVAYITAGQPETSSETMRSIFSLPKRLMNLVPSDESLIDTIRRGALHPNQVLGWCANLASQLNDHGKEVILGAAVLGAQMNQGGVESARSYIDMVGQNLGMTKAHVSGLVAQYTNA